MSYFTDPACPRSWAAEPALRRLQVEFGKGLAITYVMAPAAREFSPIESALAWGAPLSLRCPSMHDPGLGASPPKVERVGGSELWGPAG